MTLHIPATSGLVSALHQFKPRRAALLLLLATSLAGCGGDQAPIVEAGGLNDCLADPKVCNVDDLCRLALFEEDGVKRWNDANLRWQPYVREAQSRGLSCGL